MRLTLELKEDIVEFINQEKLRSGQSMNEIVNRALRDGYARLKSIRQAEERKLKSGSD